MLTLLNLELIFKSFLLSWLILNFTPIQIYVLGVLEGLNQVFLSKYKWLYILVGSIIKIPSCSKCCGLWVGIILSGNIWIGIITSILSLLFDRWNGNQKIKLW